MLRRLTKAIRDWAYQSPYQGAGAPRIGLALGGGFSRSLAHVGVLQVFQEHRIPIHCIAGISSGAIIAGAFASGSPLEDIISTGSCTTFSSYARWTLSRMGLATTERMEPYLRKALRHIRFEEMQTPFAVVATDLVTGEPVVFKDRGDVIGPVRASCSYPGLFLPVEIDGRWLVDGGISTTVPVDAVRGMGATHVLAVYLHTVAVDGVRPTNMMQVVGQCFSILQDRMATDWRGEAQIVLEPDVASFTWNSFERVGELVEAGRESALRALPRIRRWFEPAHETQVAAAGGRIPVRVPATSGKS